MALLSDLLSSRVRAAVFRLLFFDGVTELHLRDLSRRSGLSIATVRQELRKLAALDLVVCRRSGNRTYYRANGRHPLYPDIRSLVLKTNGVPELLRSALHGADVRVAFVFGSMARGEALAHSDVDLMVVGNLGLREVTRLLSGKAEQIGREINAHVLRENEFRRRLEHRDHFVYSVFESPKLFVVGDEDELEAMGVERLADAAQDER